MTTNWECTQWMYDEIGWASRSSTTRGTEMTFTPKRAPSSASNVTSPRRRWG